MGDGGLQFQPGGTTNGSSSPNGVAAAINGVSGVALNNCQQTGGDERTSSTSML